jgi:hypothetical protein
MQCEKCGAAAPTRHVVFNQNIGLLVVRFPSRVEGALCKRCIHRVFWKMTLTSLVAGWWGLISFFMNLHYISGNVSTYFQCLGMPASEEQPREREAHVTLSPAVCFSAERIAQCKDDIAQLLAEGLPASEVCEKIARRANVPESDILDYIREHVRPKMAN